MEDEPEDCAPTGIAPTELGSAVDETEAHIAWALDDDWDEPTPRLTPKRITMAAVVTSLAVAGTATGVAVYHLREPTPAAIPAPVAGAPSSSTSPAPTTIVERQEWGPPDAVPPPTKTVTVEKEPPSPILPQVTINELATYDDRFIINMRNQNWLITDRDAFVSKAHLTCTLLDNGMSPEFVATKFVNETGLDWAMAQQFISVVMATYPHCP